MTRTRSASSRIAAAISSRETGIESSTNPRTIGHISGSTFLPPIPSTKLGRCSIVRGDPSRSAAWSGAAVSTSQARILIPGFFDSAAIAIPEISPPPPKGTRIWSTSGRSSRISSPIVPLPAITFRSETGWMKSPSIPGYRCSSRTRHQTSKGTLTIEAPRRSTASSLVRGAVSGTIAVQGIPIARAFQATPCAMLPALAV